MVQSLTATPIDVSVPHSRATAWIDELCPDFGDHPFQRSPTSKRHRGVGRLAWGFDRFVTSFMSMPYIRKIKPTLTDTTLTEYLDYHAFYSQQRFLDDPSLYFEEPMNGIPVLERSSRRRSWDPKAAELIMTEFYSPFETVNPQFRKEYAGFSPNERVESRAWFHKDGPRPVVICLHGFSAPDYRINTMWFSARKFFDAGLDVVLMNLPMHGGRAPANSRFHGDAIIHPSMWRMSEACAQGIMDLRILMGYLRARGAPQVGVMGYSWGAYHGALLATIESRLDFAISIAPVVSIADLIMSWPMRAFFEYAIEDEEQMIRELRKMVAVHTPLSHSLKIPSERVFLAASANDGIVPATHTELLWEHFGKPRVYWSVGGHVIYFDRTCVAREALRFLKSIEVV